MIREFREYVEKIVKKREQAWERAKNARVQRQSMVSKASEAEAFLSGLKGLSDLPDVQEISNQKLAVYDNDMREQHPIMGTEPIDEVLKMTLQKNTCNIKELKRLQAFYKELDNGEMRLHAAVAMSAVCVVGVEKFGQWAYVEALEDCIGYLLPCLSKGEGEEALFHAQWGIWYYDFLEHAQMMSAEQEKFCYEAAYAHLTKAKGFMANVEEYFPHRMEWAEEECWLINMVAGRKIASVEEMYDMLLKNKGQTYSPKLKGYRGKVLKLALEKSKGSRVNMSAYEQQLLEEKGTFAGVDVKQEIDAFYVYQRSCWEQMLREAVHTYLHQEGHNIVYPDNYELLRKYRKEEVTEFLQSYLVRILEAQLDGIKSPNVARQHIENSESYKEHIAEFFAKYHVMLGEMLEQVQRANAKEVYLDWLDTLDVEEIYQASETHGQSKVLFKNFFGQHSRKKATLKVVCELAKERNCYEGLDPETMKEILPPVLEEVSALLEKEKIRVDAELKRAEEENERRRLEQEEKEERRRLEQEEKRRKEEQERERRRIEEQKEQERLRKLEEERKRKEAEQAAKRAEEARIAAERKAEEERIAEQNRLKAEAEAKKKERKEKRRAWFRNFRENLEQWAEESEQKAEERKQNKELRWTTGVVAKICLTFRKDEYGKLSHKDYRFPMLSELCYGTEIVVLGVALGNLDIFSVPGAVIMQLVMAIVNACLVAGIQKWLEKRFGFSLDFALSYRVKHFYYHFVLMTIITVVSMIILGNWTVLFVGIFETIVSYVCSALLYGRGEDS